MLFEVSQESDSSVESEPESAAISNRDGIKNTMLSREKNSLNNSMIFPDKTNDQNIMEDNQLRLEEAN